MIVLPNIGSLRTPTPVARWLAVTLFVASLGALWSSGGDASETDPLIDPDVTSQLSGGSRTRVLVELRIDEPGDAVGREDSIARAQNAVLSRLPRSHSLLVRRYASIPLLALEIDATALRALQTMTDIVAAVKPDQPVRSQ